MKSSRLTKPTINAITLTVLAASLVLAGCSSPYKYEQRDSNQSAGSYEKSKPVYQYKQAVEPKVVVSSPVVQQQAVNINQYASSDLPSTAEGDTDAQSGSSKSTSATTAPVKSAATQDGQPCPMQYKVKQGDSISSIAFRCKLVPKQLAKHNAIQQPYTLKLGQLLLIPQGDQVTTAPVEPTVKKKPTAKVSKTSNKLKKLMGVEWNLPVDEGQTHRFVRDSSGLSVLEFYGSSGQRVNAVAPGKVVYSGNGIINFGWMVVIKHDDGFMSVYAHNTSVLVKEGDSVKSGQFIATLGLTGNATKPTLYLEARFKGRKVDIRQIYDQL